MSQTKAFEPVLRVADSLIPKEEYDMKSAVEMVLEQVAARKKAESQKETETANEVSAQNEAVPDETNKELLNEEKNDLRVQMITLLERMTGILTGINELYHGWENLSKELVDDFNVLLGFEMDAEPVAPAPSVIVVGPCRDVRTMDVDDCFAEFDWFGDSEILVSLPEHKEIAFTCNEEDLLVADSGTYLLGSAVFMRIVDNDSIESLTMDDVAVICSFMDSRYGKMHFTDTDEYVYGYKIK